MENEIKVRFKMKKEKMIMIGMFSLLIAFVLGRFENKYPIIDFLEGMFTGISMVTNISFLVRFRIEEGTHNQIMNSGD